MSWKLMLFLLGGFYLFFLVLALPAEHVIGLWEAPPGQLAYQRPQGTWLAGESSGVWVGTFSLGRVRWRLQPASLFLGCVEYQLKFESSSARRASGRIGRCIGSRVFLADFEAVIPARDLGMLASDGLLAVAGQVEADVASLRQGGDAFREAEGAVSWKAAALEAPNRLRLGSIRMDLGIQDGALAGRLSNQGGELALAGSVISLDPAGRYVLDLRLGSPNGGPPPSWVTSVARRQQDGTYALRHTGQL